MPCDTITRNSVKLEAANFEVLAAAIRNSAAFSSVYVNERLKSISAYHVATGESLTIANGRVTMRSGYESIADEVKRAYTGEAIQTAAKKYGFAVQKDTADPRQMVLVKR